MNAFVFTIFAGASLVFFAQPASAQSPASKAKAPLSNSASKDKSEAKAEADRLAKERRAQARSLLISLASDARSFRDQALRARTLARIADTLWSVDADQGRVQFRKAWEAAETADRERGGGLINGQWPGNLRGEVLHLAAQHDTLLADEFLHKLEADQDQQETKAAHNLWHLSEALEQRLALARRLLSAGDIARALQFADPALESVTQSTVHFLVLLREQDSAAADQRYSAMLLNCRSNMAADADTVSLLSAYIFTPHLYVLGSTYWTDYSSPPPANVSQQLRTAFFQTAADVLLRFPTTPEQQSATEVANHYLILKRLIPLFEQNAPPEITDAIRNKFQALSSQVSEGVRADESEWLTKGIAPEKSATDQEQPLLDLLEHVGTSHDRDEIYVALAVQALSRDDLKARDYAGKISQDTFRKQVQAWIDANLVVNAVKKRKTERALELARTGELTHLQRLWVLTESAKLLAKTDRAKALSLLDEANSEARRIDNIDPDRPRALLAIANAQKLIEPLRAWDTAFDAVKAANSTDGFSGEDGVLDLGSYPGFASAGNRTYAVPDFDVAGIFGMLGNDDYDRAVQLARGFQGEAPRALATIAIARSVLNEKNASVPKPQPTTKK
jgi:hypothetical protein